MAAEAGDGSLAVELGLAASAAACRLAKAPPPPPPMPPTCHPSLPERHFSRWSNSVTIPPTFPSSPSHHASSNPLFPSLYPSSHVGPLILRPSHTSSHPSPRPNLPPPPSLFRLPPPCGWCLPSTSGPPRMIGCRRCQLRKNLLSHPRHPPHRRPTVAKAGVAPLPCRRTASAAAACRRRSLPHWPSRPPRRALPRRRWPVDVEGLGGDEMRACVFRPWLAPQRHWSIFSEWHSRRRRHHPRPRCCLDPFPKEEDRSGPAARPMSRMGSATRVNVSSPPAAVIMARSHFEVLRCTLFFGALPARGGTHSHIVLPERAVCHWGGGRHVGILNSAWLPPTSPR